MSQCPIINHNVAESTAVQISIMKEMVNTRLKNLVHEICNRHRL